MASLYKSSTDKVFFGVCGGIAQHFGWDSKLVRLVFVLSLLFAGTPILIYIVLIFLMPDA